MSFENPVPNVGKPILESDPLTLSEIDAAEVAAFVKVGVHVLKCTTGANEPPQSHTDYGIIELSDGRRRKVWKVPDQPGQFYLQSLDE